MSALHDLIEDRVAVARVKAGTAAREARSHSGDLAAQTAAEAALSDLLHYLEVRDAVGTAEGPYRPGAAPSFFADLVASAEHRDARALSRLEANREVRSTSASYGGMVVPAYLVDRLANSGHSSRPLCDVLAEPLPDHGTTVTLPEVTTATTAEDQDGENTTVTPDDPATTARTFQLWSVWAAMSTTWQALARAEGTGLDTFVARELVAGVDALLEARVIAGSGANGQATGILNASAGTVTLTGTTPDDLLDAVARGAATIDTARGRPADLVVMAPRRWRWLLANAGDHPSAVTPTTEAGPVAGRVLGIDVVASPGVPTALGSSTDEDRVIIARRDDLYLGADPVTAEVIDDADNQAGKLHSTIRAHRYYASGVIDTQGVQVITGTGLADPYAA